MTKRTTLFTAFAMVILGASACHDSATSPTAAKGGKAVLACATSSSCSLDTPEPTVVSVDGNVATVTWLPVEGATDYVANCSTTETATCSGIGPASTQGTTMTFTVGGQGSVTFKVRAHCDAGGGAESDCALEHIPASGQNSDWGEVTTTVDFGCQINCDDDGDIKSDAVGTMTGGTYVYDGSEHFVTTTCNDGDAVVNAYGPATDVGTYNVTGTCGGTTTNQIPLSATITITPSPVTATAGSGGGVYSGSTYSASACVVTADNLGGYTGDLACTNDVNSGGPGVGSTTTVPQTTGTGLTNYTITPVNGAIVITPASLTATAWSGNRTYGQANPTTCTVTGAVNSEVYTCTSSSTANATSPVGSTWPTTATMVANPGLSNYIVTYVDGLLTVVGYDLSGCYIPPIYSVMPSTKSYQKKGSVLPIKCVIRDTNGNIVANATGDLTLKNVTGNVTLATILNAYKFTAGTPPLYMNSQDTSISFYVVGSYYSATTKWNDGSTTVGYFYIANK